MGGNGYAGDFGRTVTANSMRIAVLEIITLALVVPFVFSGKARTKLMTVVAQIQQRMAARGVASEPKVEPESETGLEVENKPEPAFESTPETETVDDQPDDEPDDSDIEWDTEWELPQLPITRTVRDSRDSSSIDTMAEQVKETLRDYGVNADIGNTIAGPRVVRFGLKPSYVNGRTGAKVRVSDITKLDRELSLALGTPHIRINDRPEPGQNYISLEAPHPEPVDVRMADAVNSPEFQNAAENASLPVALGLDIAGNPVTLDLATTPHLLIAGATGSGKSVCLDAIITSLLLTRTPAQLQMLMIDPKRVELSRYQGVPHLCTPVITDANDALRALEETVDEMERRYQVLQKAGARNIDDYNANSMSYMSRLVVVVDEIADLVMSTSGQAEQSLIRIAQLGRSAGIHLVLATQRPSVKVVTGELKANIPARIAFAVATQTDSRVILDQNGAEALTGKGDFLLSAGGTQGLVRGQGVYVSQQELESIVNEWKEQV